jgi:Sulfotransferase domain
MRAESDQQRTAKPTFDMRPPKDNLDFIVIGAQKAGTTTLFEYLRRHPEICLPLDKEAPYFSHDAAVKRSWLDYLQRTFPRADVGSKWGTITTHYMAGGVWDADVRVACDERTVPLRILSTCPEVRLIAVLRDPVERAFSHYRMASMRGLERRTFDEAVDELLRPGSLSLSRQRPGETTSYVTWGEYGRILSAYFDVFRREQLLVLFSEELDRDPEGVLQRIYEFVGVNETFVPDNLGARYREGGQSRRFSWLSVEAARRVVSKRSGARSLWRTLPPRTRQRLDRRYAQLVYRLDLWNQQHRKDSYAPSAPTLRHLREHFVDDTAVLADLLDMQPPWSPSVRDSAQAVSASVSR